MAAVIICLVIGIVVITPLIIFNYMAYKLRKDGAIKVKLSVFKRWHAIAPKQWYLGKNYAWRYSPSQRIYFGVTGMIPYWLWKYEIHCAEKNHMNNMRLEKLLYAVQSDIDNVREQAEIEMQHSRMLCDKIKHI